MEKGKVGVSRHRSTDQQEFCNGKREGWSAPKDSHDFIFLIE
jgi:hypothetical protein